MQFNRYLFLLIAVCSGFTAIAQRSFNWDIVVPSVENVDSLHMKIIDNGENIVFSDSIATYGSRTDIPTPAITVGKSSFNVETYSSMGKAKFKMDTQYDQDVLIDVFDNMGRMVDQYKEHVNQGHNEFDIDMAKYSASQYHLRVRAKEGFASSRIVNVGGQKRVTSAKVKPLEDMLKSGSAEDGKWKFVLSHPNLLTDTFYLAPASVMDLYGSLASRPKVSGRFLDVFEMVDSLGNRLYSDGRFHDKVGVDGMKAFFGKDTASFDITDKGYFTLRPDILEGSNDTLFIINHENLKDYYNLAMPMQIVSGEILNVNGKRGQLTMPQMVFEGLDQANRVRNEDLLFAAEYILEFDKMVYLEPEYNGTSINMDIFSKPGINVYIDTTYVNDEGKFSSIMEGIKTLEAVPGLNFSRVMDKDSAQWTVIPFYETNRDSGRYTRAYYDFEFKKDKGWFVPSGQIYVDATRSSNVLKFKSAHEALHIVLTNTSDGHSLQQNDLSGTIYPSADVKMSKKDIALSKLQLYPYANPSYVNLRKETRFEKK